MSLTARMHISNTKVFDVTNYCVTGVGIVHKTRLFILNKAITGVDTGCIEFGNHVLVFSFAKMSIGKERMIGRRIVEFFLRFFSHPDIRKPLAVLVGMDTTRMVEFASTELAKTWFIIAPLEIGVHVAHFHTSNSAKTLFHSALCTFRRIPLQSSHRIDQELHQKEDECADNRKSRSRLVVG